MKLKEKLRNCGKIAAVGAILAVVAYGKWIR